ncbi:Alpha/Beta hydrolase protein [Russula dissimulans]|nr:Alpha/Beta hydrolase protein [Russula dissimulans]
MKWPVILLTNCDQLLASDFARNGFKVYAPDLFEGDPAPASAFGPGSTFDLSKWLPKHTPEHTGKRVLKVIEGLKEQGITAFGATGYCYGARLVLDAAFDNHVQVAVVSHPSLLQEKDLDTYVKKSKAPLLINSCEFDDLFPPPLAAKADEKFKDFAPGYRRTYYAGVHHGFASHGDLSNETVKAAKEDAFKSTVEWYIKYL